MLMWLVALTLAAAAIGAALLTLGLRGCRINDHPHCRRCRFDLTGLDIDAADAKCPECGRTVSQPNRIRIGARRRSPRFIVAGGVLLLIVCGGVGAGWGWAAATGFDWTPHKPVWLLEHETFGIDGMRSRIASAELLRRAEEGKLSVRAHRRLAHRAAVSFDALPMIQALNLSDLIQHAWIRDAINPVTLRALAENIASAEFHVVEDASEIGPVHLRRKLRYGWPGSAIAGLRLDCEILNARIGDVNLQRVLMNTETSEIMPAPTGLPLELTAAPMPYLTQTALLQSTSAHMPDRALTLGEQAIDLEVRWRVRDAAGAGSRSNDSHGGSVVIEWDESVAVPLRVVPESDLSPVAVVDNDFADAIRDAIYIDSAKLQEHSAVRIISVRFEVYGLPIPIAGDVFLRSGDAEWKSDHNRAITLDSHHYLARVVVDEFDSEVVDFIIRPNAKLARFAAGVREYWGHEIVIRDVPVTREE